jgi:hypothetical protein
MFVLLVIVNVLVFLHESNLGPAALRQFVWKYAFIPSKLGFTGSSMVLRGPPDLLQKISPMVASQRIRRRGSGTRQLARQSVRLCSMTES